MCVFGVAAVDDVKERILNFFGNRPTATDVIIFAQRNAIELTNGRDFGGRSGKERFIRDIDLIARDAFLHHLEAKVLGNMQNGITGDAIQSASRKVWRKNHTVFDDEYVFTSAFLDKTRTIQ